MDLLDAVVAAVTIWRSSLVSMLFRASCGLIAKTAIVEPQLLPVQFLSVSVKIKVRESGVYIGRVNTGGLFVQPWCWISVMTC